MPTPTDNTRSAGRSQTTSHWEPNARDSAAGTPRRRSSTAARGRKVKKQVAWVPILRSIIVVLLVLEVTFFLCTTPFAAIRHLNVTGTQTVEQSVITQAADVPAHKNIFLYYVLHHKQVEARVEASSPRIAMASVAIELPNTLVLHVTERQPFVVLHIQDGGSWIIDKDRIAIKEVAANTSPLPRVVTPHCLDAIYLGRPLPPGINGHVAEAYKVMALLEQRQIAELTNVHDVDVDQYDNVSLRLQNQVVIKLGQWDGLSGRVTQVQASLQADPNLLTRAAYLDFTSPRPVWKPRAPALTNLSGNSDTEDPNPALHNTSLP